MAVSERMADLLDSDGFAYGVFLNAKAACDDYGRIPADPRKFKALACPMSRKKEPSFDKALLAMVDAGVATLYEVDGDRYLEISEYNNVERTHWASVGQPDYPARPDWTPPASLVEYIISAKDYRVTPMRYGLRPEQVPGWKPLSRPKKKGGSDVGVAYPYDTPVIGVSSDSSDSTSDSTSSVDVENGNGNGNGNGSTEPPPQQFGHQVACNNKLVAAIVAYFKDVKAPEESQEYGLTLVRALKVANAGQTEETVLEAVTNGKGPKSGQEHSDNFGPERFLQRLLDTQGDGKIARLRGPPRIGNAPMTRADAIAEAERLEAARSGR